jgi:hypothetical protein
MNQNDPRVRQIESINKIINELLGYEIDKLKKEKLGQLSFADMEDYFKCIRKYCEIINNNSRLEEFSENQLSLLTNCLNQVGNSLKQIYDFDWDKHDNPKQVMLNYKSTLKNNYNTFMEGMSKFMTFLIDRKDEDYSAKIVELDNIKKEMISKSKELNKILEDSKIAAGKLGVSEHSKVFAEQAKEHLIASRIWMVATILTGLATLGMAVWSISWFMKDFEQLKVTGYAIQFAITKLVIFSIMYFTLVWVARNYRSNRHNYIVNKHRQNALSTFKTFVDAVKDDPAIQNTILNKTTDCIFSHEITGYLPKEPESSSGMQQIFEILPKITDKNV